MKCAAPSLLLFSLATTFAHAQTQTNLYPQVQHVIVVIQENRTPDNLFQQDQTLINNGAHIVSQGLCLTPNHTQVQVQLLPAPLGTCWDTNHNHSLPPASGYEGGWIQLWDNGKMDGACQVYTYGVNDQSTPCNPAPPKCSNQTVGTYCPAI